MKILNLFKRKKKYKLLTLTVNCVNSMAYLIVLGLAKQAMNNDIKVTDSGHRIGSIEENDSFIINIGLYIFE